MADPAQTEAERKNQMSIEELLESTREPQEPTRLDKLIAKAKARPMETIPVDVMFGDQPARVVFTEIRGHEWLGIASSGLPRPGNVEDARLGCNGDALLAAYPLDRITIDDEHPTVEQWREIVTIVDGSARSDIAAALWWVHIGRPQRNLAAAQALAAEAEAVTEK